MPFRRSRSILLLALLAVVGGCARAPAIELVTWTLVRPDGSTAPLQVPRHFEDELPRKPGRFQVRTRVELPAEMRGVPLGLGLPVFTGDAVLRADGVMCERSARSTPYSLGGGYRYRIPGEVTADGVVELELDVEYLNAAAAWVDVAPRLSASPEGDAQTLAVQRWNELSNAAGIAAIAAWLIVFLPIAILDRRDRATYFWIAQSASMIAMWLLYAGLGMRWLGPIGVAGMPVLLCLIAATGLEFCHALFDLGRVHWFWNAFLAATLAGIVIVGGPFRIAPIVQLMTVYTVTVSIYQLYRLFRAAIARREIRGDILMFISSWVVVLTVPFPDNARWSGTGMPLGGTSLAILAYVFAGVMTATLLGLRYVRAHRQLGARLTDVERSEREIRLLNEELRRQVAERSKELAEALAHGGELSPRPSLIGPGAVVDGRYRVERLLGSGGMGSVFEVQRITDNKPFALKVLHGVGRADQLARFAREAHIAASMSDPHLVPVVDVGFESGTLFLVMELVIGAPLDRLRDRFGDAKFALPILRDVAQGMRSLHAAGFLHRDLKPGNVLLDVTGTARISDFGIAGFEDSVDPLGQTRLPDRQLTGTGAMLGTPAYMAPELAGGARATTASDVFAFGVIAFELLTGRAAFAAPPLLLLAAGQPISSPRSLDVAGITSDVEALIVSCLALDPAKRPSADEVYTGLSRSRASVA